MSVMCTGSPPCAKTEVLQLSEDCVEGLFKKKKKAFSAGSVTLKLQWFPSNVLPLDASG